MSGQGYYNGGGGGGGGGGGDHRYGDDSRYNNPSPYNGAAAYNEGPYGNAGNAGHHQNGPYSGSNPAYNNDSHPYGGSGSDGASPFGAAKPGYSQHQQQYDNLNTADPDLRHDQSVHRAPENRRNPRYWGKKVWAAIAVLIVIVIIVAVAVGVTQSKKHASYPKYEALSYKHADSYSGTNFFDNFLYIEGADKSHGQVHYVPQPRALELNLTSATSTSATLKVDTTVGPGSVPDASTGRFSVRIESKKTYNKGLFLFDIIHTPYGCGTWPALWLTDSANWPNNGEVDIMEATNMATGGNQMTLHSTKGCSMSGQRKMTDKALKTDCNHAVNDNAGCSVEGGSDSYGETLNGNGGGVMAVEWRDEGIRMWQFARASLPADVKNKTPDPSGWGEAAADFPSTHCDIGSHFKNQSIVVNINLCGDLGNATYSGSGCPGICKDYVANNPKSFSTAFWEFGGFDIYQVPSA